ncbi:chromosome segregation ATPase [Streptomyces sp. NPDC059513]|uniref:chromosome segregation ATPase n=1 Tax=unclassified Streptomyces TaxID=2593676 RepID=UPI0036872C76
MAGTPAKNKVDGDGRPKWVPLREDQHGDLSVLARELMLARSHKTERITENTVIRVAVDLVLRHPELLDGDTEKDLRTHAFERMDQLLQREGQLLEHGAKDDGAEGRDR